MGVCASQLEYVDGVTFASKRSQSAFSQCLQKASGLRFVTPGLSNHRISSSLIAAYAPGRGLDVAVLGGGPAGLLFALRLLELGGRNVSITVYDRWKLEAGRYVWDEAPEEHRIFMVPERQLETFNSEACFGHGWRALSGSAVMPGARCFSMGSLKEALLSRVQEADVSAQLALVEGPPTLRPQPGVPGHFRSWVEGLTASHVVCAGGFDDAVRQAFADELRVKKGTSSRKRRFILAACFACEGNARLSGPLSCAQGRVFHIPDLQSKRSVLGINLRRKELDALQSFKVNLENPLLLYREGSNDAACSSRSELGERLPQIQELLAPYFKIFQLDAELLDCVMVAPNRQPPRHAFSCVRSFQDICFLGESDCSDLKDAAAVRPPLDWPRCGQGGRRAPSGSLSIALEAAEVLAQVLHKRAPISSYECFMQSVCRAGLHESRQKLEELSASAAAKALRVWRDLLQAEPDVLRASDEDLEVDFTEGGALSSWIPAEDAEEQLRDFATQSPGVVRRQQHLLKSLQAWEFLSQDLPQEALAALGDVKDRQQLDALMLTVRAEALLRLGRCEEAAEDCLQALKIFPESSTTRLVQAEVNLRLGYPADSVEDCNQLLDLDPRCAQASALRGEARLELGQLDEAVLDCDWALAHGYRSAAVFAVRGNAHRKLGNLREAIADADEALRECPSSCEALVLRGQAQLELREASAALTDLNKAIEMAGAPSAVRASALASRADAFVALQQYQKAVADCDEALQLCRNPLALAIRGEAKLLSCEYRAAVADCSAALSLEPLDPYTLAVRAEAHLCLGNRDDAIGDCDQALELSPGLEYAVVTRDRACSKDHLQE